MPPYRVCFVCTGNICRSPTAEIVLRRLAEQAGVAGQLVIDSAGLGPWHVGHDADLRAQQALVRRGYPVGGHVARQFGPRDFGERDLVLAMDAGHLRMLRRMAPDPAAAAKLQLLREYDPVGGADLDVPDPYYGEGDGFELVLDLVEAACTGLLDRLRPQLVG